MQLITSSQILTIKISVHLFKISNTRKDDTLHNRVNYLEFESGTKIQNGLTEINH